jgi:hypothetical protein
LSSRALEIIGILAIIVAPIVTLVLPDEISNEVVAAQITIKDLVVLWLVLLLGAYMFLLRGIQMMTDWLALKPFYRNVEFNYFYLQDGTVVTRNRFDLMNGWQQSSVLPEENLIWHKQIEESDLVYRLYERGRFGDRKIVSDKPSIEYALPKPEISDGEDYRYTWKPQIKPALKAKEMISFVVEIVADKTEKAAFEASGTKLGFGLGVPATKATLTAYAPFGYRFALLDPNVTIRRSSDLAEIENSRVRAPEPSISPDGTILSLSIKRPKPDERYWVHYRFESIER